MMIWKYLNIQDLNLKRGFRNRLNKMYKQEFPIQHKDDIDRDKTTLMERRRQHRCFSYCFYRVTIQILQGNRAGYAQRMKKDCYSLFPQCFSKIFKQNLIEDFYQQNKCFNSNTCYVCKRIGETKDDFTKKRIKRLKRVK